MNHKKIFVITKIINVNQYYVVILLTNMIAMIVIDVIGVNFLRNALNYVPK